MGWSRLARRRAGVVRAGRRRRQAKYRASSATPVKIGRQGSSAVKLPIQAPLKPERDQSDAEIVEVITHVAMNSFTNLLGKSTQVVINIPWVALNEAA